MPNKLSHLRAQAASNKSFRCVYCQLPMWAGDPAAFIDRFELSKRQAKLFQCTAEHLRAQCEGGKDTKAIIAAACRHSNQMRHRTANPLEPTEFQKRVRRRVGKGAWFPDRVAAKVGQRSAQLAELGGKSA